MLAKNFLKMGEKILLFVLLVFQFLILSGCVLNSYPPTVESKSALSETSTQNEQEKSDADEFVDEAHSHGFPLIFAEESFDFNDDGQLDTVRLLAEWFPTFNERNEPCYNNNGVHYPLIEFEIEGQKYTHLWDKASYESRLFLLSDINGKPIVIVTCDLGGTGAGVNEIYALSFDDEICFLNIPSYQTAYGYDQGFLATALYLDDYFVKVSVEETGFSDCLKLPNEPFIDYSMYNERGECILPECVATCESICSVQKIDHRGQDAIKLVQEIIGDASMERLGYLVSVITWHGQEYVVLDQTLAE